MMLKLFYLGMQDQWYTFNIFDGHSVETLCWIKYLCNKDAMDNDVRQRLRKTP